MGCGCGNNNTGNIINTVCDYTQESVLAKLAIIEAFIERATTNSNLYTEKNLSPSYVVYLSNLYRSVGAVENLCIYRETLNNTNSFVDLMVE